MEKRIDQTLALCRDCLARVPLAPRCAHCFGPRLLYHSEIDQLSIAHLDCDAFYASVEKRDNPDLEDKPLIIGGTGQRGVVSTACYIARTYGVRSAMPMYKARQLCPDAVIISPNMAHYRTVSHEIRQLMEHLTPLVEPLSLDEAFLDLTGTSRLHKHSPAESLAHLVQEIERNIGIRVSVGLSHNKFLAKIASDLKKPRGFALIGKAETLSFLAQQPVSLIWGVGKATRTRLNTDGITSIAQLQQMEDTALIKRYGALGLKLYHLSRGIDERQVTADAPAKSQSSETTFAQDISSYETLEAVLWQQCERLSATLKKKGLAATVVTLKLKTPRHKQISRSRTLENPTRLADTLFAVGRSLLLPETGNGMSYRLLGIGGSRLVPIDTADHPDLIEPARARRATAEITMDKLNTRFGETVIKKGRSL